MNRHETLSVLLYFEKDGGPVEFRNAQTFESMSRWVLQRKASVDWEDSPDRSSSRRVRLQAEPLESTEELRTLMFSELLSH